MIKNIVYTLMTIVCAVMGNAYANTFPSKPVTVIVPYGPGSGSDAIIRIIQPVLEKKLGVPVVIQNRAGAGGAIGTKAIADASNDGYTIGVSVVSTFAINQLFQRQTYDPLNDFSYLARLGVMPRALVTNVHFPTAQHTKILSELKINPEKYFYATVINTVDMFNFEIYKSATGAKMTQVTYGDSRNSIMLDLQSNRVQFTFDSLPVLTPWAQKGNIKLVAITGTTRNSQYPDVPTFSELGIKDLTASSWYGFVAPKNLEKDRQDVLVKAIHDALGDLGLKNKIAQLGIEISPNTPAEHRKEIADSIELYARIAKKLGIIPQP